MKKDFEGNEKEKLGEKREKKRDRCEVSKRFRDRTRGR